MEILRGQPDRGVRRTVPVVAAAALGHLEEHAPHRLTAKAYISPETPIRSYYTVIAVPDGVETGDFLRRSGWRDVADEREEGLFVLEPGAGGWGDAAAEPAYVEAAMSFYESNRYFSIFGEQYLAGYGAGAPARAVAHPLRVDSPGLPRTIWTPTPASSSTAPRLRRTPPSFLAGFDLIRHDEVVLPTWYVNPRATAAASLAYWKGANDAGGDGERDGTLGTVFRQRHTSGRWMTSHAKPHTTDRGVAFLSRYTRSENFFAYGNRLHERADYRRLGVAFVRQLRDAVVREYPVDPARFYSTGQSADRGGRRTSPSPSRSTSPPSRRRRSPSRRTRPAG